MLTDLVNSIFMSCFSLFMSYEKKEGMRNEGKKEEKK